MNCYPFAATALAVAFSLPAAPVSADPIHWVGADGGAFTSAANWSGGVLPDDTADAVIATSLGVDVMGPGAGTAPLQVFSLTVGGGAGSDTLYLVEGGQLSTSWSTQLQDNGRLAVYSGTDALFATGWLGGALITHPGSALVFKANTPQVGYDRLVIDGPLFVQGGTFALIFDGMPQLHAGDRYNFIDWINPVRPAGASALADGTPSGFDQLLLPALPAGLAWDTSRFYTDGTLGVQAVPEPASYAMLMLGLLGVGWRVRQRTARHQA